MRMAYARMLSDGLDGDHGLPRGRLAELTRRFGAVQAEVRERRAAGDYGFYELVDQDATVKEIAHFAEGLGQAYDHVLVLGIGDRPSGPRPWSTLCVPRPGTSSTTKGATSSPASPCWKTSIRPRWRRPCGGSIRAGRW
jgi:hypothetical protein